MDLIAFPAGSLSRTGLSLPSTLGIDDWRLIGKELRRIEGSVMWWLGDWLAFGEHHKWGEKYSEAVALGFEYQSARDAKWVAESIDLSRRRDKLSWSHHKEVAALSPSEQDRLLETAIERGWAVHKFREEIRIHQLPNHTPEDGCTVEELNLLVDDGKKYAVIYADPPWSFKVYSGKGKQRSAERHYPTKSLDEIKALPVNSLAANDSALLLWAVMPQLPEALEVISAWGFTYKTAGFVWVKENESSPGLHWGMGYWTRANAEMCLLATKGSPKRLARDVHQIVQSPVSEHSRKPDEVQARIERLLPGPYLELYGRRASPNWTVWGNDISRSLFHRDIPEFVAEHNSECVSEDVLS